MSRLPLVLDINGVALSSPPAVHKKPVNAQKVKEVNEVSTLDGLRVTRVAPTRVWRITIELPEDAPLWPAEHQQLKTLEVGDVITLRENYTEPTLTVWQNCVVAENPSFPRKLMDPNTTGPKADVYGLKLVLQYQEDA